MDTELTDTETRNWVKTCIALRYVTEGILPFIKSKCDEQYSLYRSYLKQFCGLTDYTCNTCQLPGLKPYHARVLRCKYPKGKRECGCKGKQMKQCPQNEICGKLYDLVKDKHVTNDPNWSNTKSELWSDKQLGPWEVMKCFIFTPGYKERADISKTDVTALVQICTNHKDLKTELGYRLALLDKIREIRNDVCHSGTMTITSDRFKIYAGQITDVLRLDIFADDQTAKDQLQRLRTLANDEERLTIEDELKAREDTLAAIKELKRFIEEHQKANTELVDNIRDQIAHLTSVEEQHNRKFQERFNKIESHLRDLKEEYMNTIEWLSEHKGILDNIQSTMYSQNEQLSFISKILKDEVRPVLQQSDKILAVLEKIWKTCDATANPSINKIYIPDLRLVIKMNDKDEGMVSTLIVETANGIKVDVPPTQLRRILETVLKKLNEDYGVHSNAIKNECVAIYLGFPTLQSWLGFLDGYFKGDIGKLFLPVQEHLRTYLGFEDIQLIVVVYEEDFMKCAQTLSFELETLSFEQIPHYDRKEETEHRPVRAEGKSCDIAAEDNDTHERETHKDEQVPCNETDVAMEKAHYKATDEETKNAPYCVTDLSYDDYESDEESAPVGPLAFIKKNSELWLVSADCPEPEIGCTGFRLRPVARLLSSRDFWRDWRSAYSTPVHPQLFQTDVHTKA